MNVVDDEALIAIYDVVDPVCRCFDQMVIKQLTDWLVEYITIPQAPVEKFCCSEQTASHQ